MNEWKREGYSLVELMIAMALTAIVLAGLLALFGYSSHNMRITQAQVALQNQAKDATNHISTYAMEADDIKWDVSTGKDVLVITKPITLKDEDSGETTIETETCYYWVAEDGDDGKAICFTKKKTKEILDEDEELENLPSELNQQYLLVDDITGFKCEVKENDVTGKKVLHVEIDLENDRAEFKCEKDIYMRNQ